MGTVETGVSAKRMLRPTEWIQKMLDSRGLTATDGRALFKYRLTDSEYQELAEIIQFTSRFGVENIASMLSWDAIFVLYASEWWRREFCGKWGWKEVFKSVGIDFVEMPVGVRNNLIEIGLNRWHRQVRVRNGTRRFLGTIATEGGLPLHKLSESGGWLKSILQPVLRRHVARGHAISALIDAHSSLIPVSLRSQEISDVLEDVAQAIVDLREQHHLSEKGTPIQWLDEHVPDWREDFPLPLDDGAAKSLLSELVDTASRAKVDHSSANPFEMERFLVRVESGTPELLAEMEIPKFVSLESIGLNPDVEALPSTMELEVFNGAGSTWPWCRALLTTFRNDRVLKLSGLSFRIEGEDARNNLGVRLKSMGQCIKEVEIVGANALESEIPWLFKELEGKWKVHGTASQSIKNDDGLVFCPESYSIETNDEASNVSPIAAFLGGQLWNLSGTAVCSSGLDRFRFKTGGNENVISYHLRGKRFPFESKPGVVFIGKPDVMELDGLTGRHKKRDDTDTRLIARKLGSEEASWGSLESIETGVYQVRVVDSDASVLFSQVIGILGESYSHELKPNPEDPCSGSIDIDGVGSTQLSCTATNTSVTKSSDSECTRFDLLAALQPPKSVQVSLLPKGQGREVVLTYPFPTRGALLFDAEGKLVQQGKSLHCEELPGHRLKIFNDKTHLSARFSLTLTLLDLSLPKADRNDIYIKRAMKLEGEYVELAISDWSSAVQSLFGVSASIDAVVRASLTLDGNSLIQIYIRRYKHELQLIREEGVLEVESSSMDALSIDDVAGARVHAFRLSHPEEQAICLSAQSSQGVAVGRWEFNPWERENGSWLIIPAVDSSLEFRPVLWNVGTLPISEGADKRVDTLSLAVGIGDHNQRIEEIRVILCSMAENFDHQSWSYLDSLWEVTANLPMSCFDVWQVVAREPRFLAALLVKSSAEIIAKLEQEYPILWELVSLEEWESALNTYAIRMKTRLDEDDEFVDELLEKCIQRIETQSISLVSMGAVLRGTIIGMHSPDMKSMKLSAEEVVKPLLIYEYQKLFQRQANSDWPELLKPKILSIYNEMPTGFSSIVTAHNHFQQSTVYLPFVLAWNAIRGGEEGWCSSAVEIFKIQQLQRFDEDWFNVAFQFLSGWLSQHDEL